MHSHDGDDEPSQSSVFAGNSSQRAIRTGKQVFKNEVKKPKKMKKKKNNKIKKQKLQQKTKELILLDVGCGSKNV